MDIYQWDVNIICTYILLDYYTFYLSHKRQKIAKKKNIGEYFRYVKELVMHQMSWDPVTRILFNVYTHTHTQITFVIVFVDHMTNTIFVFSFSLLSHTNSFHSYRKLYQIDKYESKHPINSIHNRQHIFSIEIFYSDGIKFNVIYYLPMSRIAPDSSNPIAWEFHT